MADRPFVYIRSSGRGRRPPGPPGRSQTIRFPDWSRQRERIGPRIDELEAHFALRASRLSESAAGTAPEEVIVFETAGSIDDFVKAVRRIAGMEWLVESDEFDSDADEDFALAESGRDTYPSRLYLVLTNQQALQQMLRIWTYHQQVQEGRRNRMPQGSAPWRHVFQHLQDVRLWGPADRLRDTGLIEDWQERLARRDDDFPVEIDLWFRGAEAHRRNAEETIARSVADSGGQVVSTAAIPAIGYHGMLARLPADAAARLVLRQEVALVLSGPAMLLRPAGQFAVPRRPSEVADHAPAFTRGPLPQGSPRVALLDGAPLSRHELLEGRIILSDPDELSELYGAGERIHGTGMASAIIHGDLNSGNEPLTSPLLQRPIMRPDPRTIDRVERTPDDTLAVDLIHRTVREIVDDEGPDPPVGPEVRLINLSIADRNRPLEHMMSPMARLLDWLSWRYNVLFVVSAGNHADDISLDVPRDDFEDLSEDAKNRAVTMAIWRTARLRSLLSPAESLNAITVASTHEDGSWDPGSTGASFFESRVFPSPLNPLGLGYARSVKPDVLAPGGRQPYRLSPVSGDGGCGIIHPAPEGAPPGVLVADGGGSGAALGRMAYTRGTSNAAAAVSRLGAKVLDVLQSRSDPVDPDYLAVVTKCLIGHSAEWLESWGLISNAIAAGENRTRRRIAATRFLGFGRVAEERATTATDQRATLVGWGHLANDECDLYEIPLPSSLSGTRLAKRLTVTLAWFTPTNPADRRYRQAKLWFETVARDENQLGVSRAEVEHNMVRRGTLQHEIFEGESASAFLDGALLRLRVSCREDAGGLGDTPVRYALAISLEAAEKIEFGLVNPVMLYDEVLNRIRAAVRLSVEN